MRASFNEIDRLLRIVGDTRDWKIDLVENNLVSVNHIHRETYWVAKKRFTTKTLRREMVALLKEDEVVLRLELPLNIFINANCEYAIQRYLLNLNQELRLVRFSVDPYQRVYLVADILLENLSRPAVNLVFSAVETYIDQHFLEIQCIAQDRTFAASWLAYVSDTMKNKHSQLET